MLKLTKKQLKKIIFESLLNEDTRQLEKPLIEYLKTNSSFFTKELDVSERMLSVLGYTAISVTGRESSYGEGKKYNYTDWAENAMSTLSHYTGIDSAGIRSYSTGAGQMKFSTVDNEVSDIIKDKVGLSTPNDLQDDMKSLLAIVALLATNYNKAKKVGYDTNSPGSIAGSTNVDKANKKFISTGNSALDMAITGHNAGSSKIKKYIKKEDNYIPCFGPFCSGNPGVATYAYVAHVSKYLTEKSIKLSE